MLLSAVAGISARRHGGLSRRIHARVRRNFSWQPLHTAAPATRCCVHTNDIAQRRVELIALRAVAQLQTLRGRDPRHCTHPWRTICSDHRSRAALLAARSQNDSIPRRDRALFYGGGTFSRARKADRMSHPTSEVYVSGKTGAASLSKSLARILSHRDAILLSARGRIHCGR